MTGCVAIKAASFITRSFDAWPPRRRVGSMQFQAWLRAASDAAAQHQH